MPINIKLLRETYLRETYKQNIIVKKRNIKKQRGIFCIKNVKYITAVNQLINKHFIDINAYQNFINKIKIP